MTMTGMSIARSPLRPLGSGKELAALGKAEKAARKAEHEAFGRTFSTVGITLPRTDTRDTSLAV